MAAKMKKKSSGKAKSKPKGKSAAKAKTHKALTKKTTVTKAKLGLSATRPKPEAVKIKMPSPSFAHLLTPLDDRILIIPQAKATKTAGGLIIPDTVMSSRPNQGKVVATGRGRRNKKGQLRPLDVCVGDEVMFAEYAGTKLTVMDNEVLILREEDVLGIVT